MAFDAARSQVVLFGGYSDAVMNDTWIWQGADWIKLSRRQPPAMYLHSMTYDAERKEVVLLEDPYSEFHTQVDVNSRNG